MRSIYITHAYNTTALNANQRDELAIKMRHSSFVAARAYFKITNDKANNNRTDVKGH